MNGHIGLIAHCDWSVDKKKRWMAVATRNGDRWHIALPEPVGTTDDLFERLKGRSPDGAPIFVGFDFPIGLPVAYGQRTALADFRTLLGQLGRGMWADWFRVCERPHEITPHRPFYPMRPGGTARQHLLQGLGATETSDLLRQCDRRTADRGDACSIFWTLGGNQVGKAAISGWRELLHPSGQIAIWPFDGRLEALLAQEPVVVAETYPGDAYGQLGIPRTPVWSKRKQDGRARVGSVLLACIDRCGHQADEALITAITTGFGSGPEGEDQFDAVVGLLAMLEVVEGRRSDGCPYDVDTTSWEGWILGHARETSEVQPARKSRSIRSKQAQTSIAVGASTQQGQRVVAQVDLKDHDQTQRIYVMQCMRCTSHYGSHASDMLDRQCPTCGEGPAAVSLDILTLLQPAARADDRIVAADDK